MISIQTAKLIRYCATGLFLLIFIPIVGLAQDDSARQSSALLQKADSLQHYARYDSSNHYYRKAADLFEQTSNYEKQRDALFQISVNKFEQDDTEAATTLLERSRSISQNRLNDELFDLRYYHRRGILTEADADYGTAMEWYQKGIALADRIQAPEFAVRFKTGIAEVYASRGNYQKSVEQFSEAQNDYFRNQIEDDRLLSRIYNGQGIAHQKSGEYKEALKYFRRALETEKQRLPDPHPELAKGYNNLALVYYYQSDFQRALNYMQNAVNVLADFHGENHRLVAAGYNNIGVVYSEMGDLEGAVEYLQKSLRIKENILGKTHPEVAVGYQNLGAIYSDMENYDEAIANYRRAESLHLENFEEGHPELANVYANFGEAFSEKGEYEKALEFYQKDLDINRRLLSADHPFIGDTYFKIGRLYAEGENYEQALRYYNQALEILVTGYSRENPNQEFSLNNSVYPDLLLPVLQHKADAFYQQGHQQNSPQRLEQALQVYLKAVRFIDELQQSLIRTESKFLLREKAVAVYQDGFKTAFELFKETGSSDYKEYLFYIAQKSRNQILLEQIEELQNRSFAEIPDSLLAKEHQLRTRITDLQQQLTGFASQNTPGDSLKRVTIQDSLFYARQKLQGLMEQLQVEFPKYYGLKFEPVVASVSEVQQELLAPSQTMISYFSTGESLFAFIISQNSFKITEVGDSASLQQDITNFREVIFDSSSVSEYSRQSYDLYRQLFEPISADVAGDRLLIIPGGALHYLPFESLLTKSISNPENRSFRKLPYLLNDYAVSYAPSAGYLKLRNQMETSRDQKKMIAFAPSFNNESSGPNRDLYPGYDRPVTSLLFNEREVQKLGNIFNRPEGFWSFLKSSKDEADIYTGTQASESTLKNLSLSNYQFIHLATHAFLDEKHPNQSGILFSIPDSTADGTLRASEVYNLSLDAELVTLSACQTGMGMLAEGEGMIGLSRAFQYAGSRNLLVSLWAVNDRSSEQLMVDFYRRLKESNAMSPALREAKRSMIDRSRYAHPKHWSPFILVGK